MLERLNHQKFLSAAPILLALIFLPAAAATNGYVTYDGLPISANRPHAYGGGVQHFVTTPSASLRSEDIIRSDRALTQAVMDILNERNQAIATKYRYINEMATRVAAQTGRPAIPLTRYLPNVDLNMLSQQERDDQKMAFEKEQALTDIDKICVTATEKLTGYHVMLTPDADGKRVDPAKILPGWSIYMDVPPGRLLFNF